MKAGYRHIVSIKVVFPSFIDSIQDSAEWYENEHEVGQAILDFCKLTGIDRSEIFFTTKLKKNNGYYRTRKAIERSLKKCGLGYIDLYLIHGPLGGSQARKESWEAIYDAQKEGILKSAGISTFGMGHLQEILEYQLPLPVVHQVSASIRSVLELKFMLH